jgi:hypothetical protein
VEVAVAFVRHERGAEIDEEIGPGGAYVLDALFVSCRIGVLIEVRVRLFGESEAAACFALRVKPIFGGAFEVCGARLAVAQAVSIMRVRLQSVKQGRDGLFLWKCALWRLLPRVFKIPFVVVVEERGRGHRSRFRTSQNQIIYKRWNFGVKDLAIGRCKS